MYFVDSGILSLKAVAFSRLFKMFNTHKTVLVLNKVDYINKILLLYIYILSLTLSIQWWLSLRPPIISWNFSRSVKMQYKQSICTQHNIAKFDVLVTFFFFSSHNIHLDCPLFQILVISKESTNRASSWWSLLYFLIIKNK